MNDLEGDNMTPDIVGMRITRSIQSVENDMDELLAKASELMAEIARGRLAIVDEAHSTQRPMARVAAMQRSLIEARSELVRAHSDLSKLAETMDIPVRCPDKAELFDADAGEQRLVEAA
nr:hypothetical protein [Novosphingobium panipatense]